jgi:hypothetical protein
MNDMRKLMEAVELDEVYHKSIGYEQVENSIYKLRKALRPDSVLCRKISENADNVEAEFAEMSQAIERIAEIWDEVDYIIGINGEE